MADDANLNASLGMSSEGWKKGLSDAQVSAAQFVAFMATLNSKLEGVASGSISVANAMASIGATSAAVRSELESLANGSQTISKVQANLGLVGNQLIAQVDSILQGNTQQMQSYQAVGGEIDKVTEKLIAQTKALETLASLQKTIASRKISRDAVAQAQNPRQGRIRSAATFESTNPLDYSSADEIAIARKIQRFKALAAQYKIAMNPPGVEMGEGKQALNMARLNMAFEQLKGKILEVRASEKNLDREARECFASMARGAKDYVRAAVQAQKETDALAAKQRKLRATESRRQMDQMFAAGPSRTRAGELQALGVITGLQTATKNTHGWADKLFKKFEAGTSIATKGTMALVRGLNSAQSAMAFMTSSFTGLVAMITGATIGGFFKMAMDFEKAMARVNLLVKKGESDLGTLTAQVKELSKQFGVGASDMAAGFRIAISSDVAPEEIMSFMKESNKLAVTHAASVEKTTDLLSMLKNAFGLATSDLSHLRDMIFVMTDRGRTEVEQFSAEIGKIAPTARLAGASIQEMMAAFAALSRTRSTEQAGTLLRNLFKNIIEPSSDAKTQLKKIELGLTPVQVKAQGLMETIRKFREELQKNPAVLNDVAEDLRELSAWGELTDSQFEALNSTFNEMGNSVGLADQKFAEMADTTAVRWDRLTAQLKISAMEMVEGIIESFAGITKGTGNIEIAQKKIESMFKRIELAARYFLLAVEFVGTMAMVGFGAIVTPLVVIWGLLKNIKNFADRGMASARIETITGRMEELRDQIVKLKQEEGLGQSSPQVQAIEAQIAAAQKGLDKYMADLDASEVDIEQTIKGTVSSIEAAWKPTMAMAEAFVNSSKRAGELAQEIADLSHVIEIMEVDAKAAGNAANGLTGKLGQAKEEMRDKEAALAEAQRANLEQQVKLGKDALKQWVVDHRDTIQGIIAGYRKLATEQKSVVKELQKSLKDLIKDQRDFDDSINDQVEKIKDVDRTPEQKITRLKDRGREMEKRANAAAKEGDREEVQRLLQQAMGYYQEILSVSDTKVNRKVVIDALERLKGEMDKVYGAEKSSLQEKIATAENAAAAFTEKANQVEANFKKLEQGIRDVTREIENMGKHPTMETLEKLKTKIASLIGSTDFFIDVQADPALASLDKMIEKAKEFGAEMKKAFEVPERMMTPEEARRHPDFVPMDSEINRNNTTIHNRITNVDSVNVGVGGGEGPKKADARRLARDIKRHIERGEAPALTKRR